MSKFSETMKKQHTVIIWGAGKLGTRLGARLLDLGLPLKMYWDIRSSEIAECNGIPVASPFAVEPTDGVVVVFAITNGHIRAKALEELRERNYAVLSGEDIYGEIVCPLSQDNFDIVECTKRPECNTDTCEKLNRLISFNFPQSDKVLIRTVHLMVTQRCSLGCKYCLAYMNSYPPAKRKDFDTERILKDIDALSSVCSYIKRLVVYGGEPMLHKDIEKIVNRASEKENIGIVDLVTNGLFKLNEESVLRMDRRKLRFEFSNYSEAIAKEQSDVIHANYERLKELGLKPFMHSITPEWLAPRTIENKNWDTGYMRELKSNCDYFPSDAVEDAKAIMLVAGGVMYPCKMACTINTVGLADYREDYLVIDGRTAQELVDAINNLYARPYFETCRHCTKEQGEVVRVAGEQGFDERYAPGAGKCYCSDT
jgi:hypothetical protein